MFGIHVNLRRPSNLAMSSRFKNTLIAVFSNDWTVTLVATMLGVLAGIYLNGFFTRSNLEVESQGAVRLIVREVEKNQDIVKSTLEVHHKFLPAFQFVFDNLDKNQDIVVASSEMRDFQRNHPDTYVLSDSALIEEGVYKYKGEMYVEFDAILSVQLSDIAWETLTNSNLSSVLDYDCLYYFSFVYRLQKRVRDSNEALLSNLTALAAIGKRAESFEKRDALLAEWKTLIETQQMLLDAYQAREEALQDCR